MKMRRLENINERNTERPMSSSNPNSLCTENLIFDIVGNTTFHQFLFSIIWLQITMLGLHHFCIFCANLGGVKGMITAKKCIPV